MACIGVFECKADCGSSWLYKYLCNVCVKIFLVVEAVRLEYIGNAAIEALDHAIGARRSGLDQAVLDIEPPTRLVKHVPAAGFTFTAGKQPIGELLAVVGQDLGNLDRTGLLRVVWKRWLYLQAAQSAAARAPCQRF